MLRVITVLTIIIVSLFFSTAKAQNSKSVPCSSEEYSQFDFWIGEWNVYDSQGNLIGENLIKKMPNACAIQENWTSKKGSSQGTSYNYYDATDKQWHQLWIDNTGFSLKLHGTFTENQMSLSSDIVQSEQGDFYNKVTWTLNEDGSVTQVWEYLKPDHTLVKEAFRGIYKKK